MIVLLHLTIAATCIAVAAIEFRRGIAGIAFAMFMLVLSVVHGVVPAVKLDAQWDTSAQNLAALMAFLGVIAFVCGWWMYSASRPVLSSRKSEVLAALITARGQRALKVLCLVAAIMGVAAWLGEMIATAGSIKAAWQAGRFEFRGQGNLLLTVPLLHTYLFCFSMVAFLCFFLQRRARFWALIFSITMVALLYLGSQGGRGTSLGILAALWFGYAFNRRLGRRWFVYLAVGVALAFVLATGLFEARKHLSSLTLQELGEILTDADTYGEALEADPLNYHEFLVRVVEVFPKQHPYLDGATYRRILFFMVPRSVAPWLKPEDTNNVFGRLLTRSNSTITVPPTMMGDGYINFWGWPGVIFVMMMQGALFALGCRRMQESPLWFFAFGSALGRNVVMAPRGQPYEVFATLASAALLSWLFLVVSRRLLGWPRPRGRKRLEADEVSPTGDGVVEAK